MSIRDGCDDSQPENGVPGYFHHPLRIQGNTPDFGYLNAYGVFQEAFFRGYGIVRRRSMRSVICSLA